MDRGAWRLTFNRAAKSQTQPSDLTTCVCVRTCMHAQSFQSCPTLRDPKGHTPQGSSVHEIFLARIQKWVAKPFSRGPSWPRDQTCVCCVSCIAGGLLSLSHQGSPCVCVCVCVCVYTLLWTTLGGIIIPVLEALNLFIPEKCLYRKKLSESLL